MLLREVVRRLCWSFMYWGPQRDITIDTFNGLLSFDSKDWLIGKYLYVKRSYEAQAIQSTMTLLRKEGYLADSGKVLVDVGANIGMTCIALVKHGYFEKAIAFEPAPTSYRLLVQNIRQNHLSDRVCHFPWALSDKTGTIDLELSTDNSGNHRLRQTTSPGSFREEQRKTVQVAVKTLDDVIAGDPRLSEESISLVWVDVEGHEGYFYLGAERLLKMGPPVVSEFWPYAMERSLISPARYCEIVSELFTHFYTFAGEQYERRSISEIHTLFDVYKKPREMCQIILVRDK
jgi:FkbM family methyltransferase